MLGRSRYNVGDHMKKKKEQKEKIIQKNRKIQELEVEIRQLKEEIAKKKLVLEAKQVQSKRLDGKVRY